MDSLIEGASGGNRPLFQFGEQTIVSASAIPSEQLTLSGPSEKLDADHLPVRGDLAHIRLAGRCFVPHYAVPMPHLVTAAGTALHRSGNAHGDVLDTLPDGALFNVLDIAGGWAWGQVGEAGLVGYLPLTALVAQ